jgi:formate dehydrogenase major subunit
MVLIEADGIAPLPRGNSRFGHPTPQLGVEVERKWKRIDYRAPGGATGGAPGDLVQIQTK